VDAVAATVSEGPDAGQSAIAAKVPQSEVGAAFGHPISRRSKVSTRSVASPGGFPWSLAQRKHIRSGSEGGRQFTLLYRIKTTTMARSKSIVV
jgi:hypothetical protein